MFTQMRNRIEQVRRSVARVLSFSRMTARVMAAVQSTRNVVASGTDALALTTAATFAWNVKPCVHQPAICTHGKPYARRLQEILT